VLVKEPETMDSCDRTHPLRWADGRNATNDWYIRAIIRIPLRMRSPRPAAAEIVHGQSSRVTPPIESDERGVGAVHGAGESSGQHIYEKRIWKKDVDEPRTVNDSENPRGASGTVVRSPDYSSADQPSLPPPSDI
jgi:hypothetical protein